MVQNKSVDKHDEEEDHLPGAFSSSLIVGAIILIFWVCVFSVYLSRL